MADCSRTVAAPDFENSYAFGVNRHSSLGTPLTAWLHCAHMSITAEHRSFEIPHLAVFEEGAGGLTRLAIATRRARAHIYLHGAHVTYFEPEGTGPVLFLSDSSLFLPDKAIRGGVPIIFPWFGARAGQSAAPVHGFARTTPWEVEAISCGDDEAVDVTLRLRSNEETLKHWPHEFILRYRIAVSDTLTMSLELENVSDKPCVFEEALHTYLTVSDVRNIAISGLADAEYIDKVDALARKREGDAPIRIVGETDRVYLHTQSACDVNDPGARRRLHVTKRGSDSTVVWNPWIVKAAALPDFGNDEWPRMLCIETANAADNTVTLAAGATHTMSATVACSAL